jgi:REP element-mobilizing transposase RayT
MPRPDRHWLLTWTTYGTWLPGDERGFVSPVLTSHRRAGDVSPPPEAPSKRTIHNTPGGAIDRDEPKLKQLSRDLLKGPPIFLDERQAAALLKQFQETAAHRGWVLLAAAIMRAHVHLVVGVPGDPDPEKLLGDFKAYGSRTLNRDFGRRASDTWWTENGSTRVKRDERAIIAAVRYVARQEKPLVVWVNPDYQWMLDASHDKARDINPQASGGRKSPGSPK